VIGDRYSVIGIRYAVFGNRENGLRPAQGAGNGGKDKML
jgi:hypothetical protein